MRGRGLTRGSLWREEAPRRAHQVILNLFQNLLDPEINSGWRMFYMTPRHAIQLVTLNLSTIMYIMYTKNTLSRLFCHPSVASGKLIPIFNTEAQRKMSFHREERRSSPWPLTFLLAPSHSEPCIELAEVLFQNLLDPEINSGWRTPRCSEWRLL